jgi:hypothetical protein
MTLNHSFFVFLFLPFNPSILIFTGLAPYSKGTVTQHWTSDIRIRHLLPY